MSQSLDRGQRVSGLDALASLNPIYPLQPWGGGVIFLENGKAAQTPSASCLARGSETGNPSFDCENLQEQGREQSRRCGVAGGTGKTHEGGVTHAETGCCSIRTDDLELHLENGSLAHRTSCLWDRKKKK